MTTRELRRSLGHALVVSLTVAALTARIAIVSGNFGDLEARVIGTSLGFAVFSAFAASGGSMRLRARDERQLQLGTATAVLAGISFLVLLPAIWIDDPSEDLWKFCGCLSLATIACSHTCLVVGSRRTTDSASASACAGSRSTTCADLWNGRDPRSACMSCEMRITSQRLLSPTPRL
jgi:hypothetical protein